MKTSIQSQAWRLVRLGAVTFGHAAWAANLPLVPGEKAAIAAGAVAVTEAAYRQVMPTGKAAQILGAVQAAWKMVQAAEKQ